MSAPISLKNLQRQLGGVTILKGINAHVLPGQVVALLGKVPIWFGWLATILAVLFSVMTALLDLFWVPNISQDSQHGGIVLIFMLAVLLLLRYWSRYSWRRINFYRVKN